MIRTRPNKSILLKLFIFFKSWFRLFFLLNNSTICLLIMYRVLFFQRKDHFLQPFLLNSELILCDSMLILIIVFIKAILFHKFILLKNSYPWFLRKENLIRLSFLDVLQNSFYKFFIFTLRNQFIQVKTSLV